jgi:formate-dependent nitrite reductase cytochrome c552 subunit
MHPVVTPADCAACHPVEEEQFRQNRMAHAYGNLMQNPLFQDLMQQAISLRTFDGKALGSSDPGEGTRADACLACHGTEVRVTGTETRDTEQAGPMTFPVLSNWPNQGVGRVNPDGTLGSCAACHTRHAFSIAVARKAETCGTCHKGPDVPAYPIWSVSKHGVLVKSQEATFDFEAVPWVPGRDFTAPTCAACGSSASSSAITSCLNG